MAMIELMCRYAKDPKSKEAKQIESELITERIIAEANGKEFDYDAEKMALLEQTKGFDYGPLVLNLRDVSTFNLLDEQHTTISLHNNRVMVFRIPYAVFMGLYQLHMSVHIHDYTVIEIPKTHKGKNAKR